MVTCKYLVCVDHISFDRNYVVTARKNRPFSYRFTQANQKNSWTILDWTSQIPHKVAFSSENNLGE